MRLAPVRPAPPAVSTLMLALSIAVASAARAEDAPPPPTVITADLGYVSTAGNSDVQTLTANDNIEHHHDRWLFRQEGAAVYGTTGGVESAGRYGVGLRAEYSLGERVGVFALASWRRNTFAGISRQFDEGVGAVFHALVPMPQQLDLEAGVGGAQRRSVTGLEENFGTGRGAVLYRYYLKEKTYFEANGVYLHNFKHADDYEYDLTSALVAPLSANLAVKLGYNYHWRNQPPPGFRNWDSAFAAGIQATF